jgi:hypothetical protein
MPDQVNHVPESRGGIEEMVSPVSERDGTYSPLQLHFLRRLNRLLRLRADQSGQLNEDGLRLIDRAIYSTYCDAVDVGVATDAQRLVQRKPVPSSSGSAE